MKITSIIKVFRAAALLMAGFAFTSCNDEAEPEPQRLFRPVNVQLSTLENTVTAKWAAMSGALSYQVELYGEEKTKDPDGNTVTNYGLVASNYNLEGSTWTVTDLKYATTYHFRVKANSGNPEYDSRFSSLESIKTQTETVVVWAEVTDADNGSVLFQWLEGYNLTELTVYGPDDYEKTFTVDDASGQYEVTGLKSGDYTVTAYNASRAFNTYAFNVPILREMIASDNTVLGVTFRWANVEGVKEIRVVENTATDPDKQTFDITGATGFEYFTDALKAETTYTATIYMSDGSAGNSISFTTMKSLPSGTVFVSTATELKAAVEGATEGDVIAVNPGTYEIRSTTDNSLVGMAVKAGFTLTAASAEQPVIVCKLFSIANTADIDLIRIENIIWHPKTALPVSGEGTYLFDMTAGSTGNVKAIEISGLTLSNIESSLLRVQSTKYGVMNFYVDDCQMFNMAGRQNFITHTNAAEYKMEKISITNSTITGIGMLDSRRMFYLVRSEKLEIKLENNTFVLDYSTSAIIDLSRKDTAATGDGKISIKNNVIYNNNFTATRYIKTPNFGGGEATIDNNNLHVPFVTTVADGEITVTETWDAHATNTEDPMFVDFDNNNLTLGNQNLAKLKIGDPRWW